MPTDKFRMKCPKCSSTNIEIYREGIGWGRSGDLVLHCHVCGKYVYGEKQIDPIRKEQTEAWEAERTQNEKERRAIQDIEATRRHQQQQALLAYLQHTRNQGEQLYTRIDLVVGQLEGYIDRLDLLSIPNRDLSNLARLVRLDIMGALERATESRLHVDRIQRATNPQAARGQLLKAQEVLEDVCTRLVEVSRRFDRLEKQIQEQPEPLPPPKVPEPPAPTCAWHACDKPAALNSKYCSRDCRNRNARWRHKRRRVRQESNVVELPKAPPKPRTRITVKCAWCDADLERMPYQIRRNKSGLFFCNHEHNQLWVANQGSPKIIDMGRV